MGMYLGFSGIHPAVTPCIPQGGTDLAVIARIASEGVSGYHTGCRYAGNRVYRVRCTICNSYVFLNDRLIKTVGDISYQQHHSSISTK